ncbi:hypothetical protein [Thiocapsa sp.]|uniref:hypothetical protein n=1 Tax=Thiocapsa sp. TaxID=2024551 RepID=UPI0025CD49E9|nr:hypothetical protein [Thiocapsa sp.]
MARDDRLLARRASGLRREGYREQALAMREQTASIPTLELQRLQWLDPWLKQQRSAE